jgi:hypothetical protein
MYTECILQGGVLYPQIFMVNPDTGIPEIHEHAQVTNTRLYPMPRNV